MEDQNETLQNILNLMKAGKKIYTTYCSNRLYLHINISYEMFLLFVEKYQI